MVPNLVDVPVGVQASLGLDQGQLASVQRYLGLQADLARRQRNILIALCIIIISAFMVNEITGGTVEHLPFESLVQVAFRYLTYAAAGIALVFTGILQLSAQRLRGQLGQLELTKEQCARVRKLGDALTLYMLFGPLGLIGRKKV